jgi:hypothetical protein
MDKESILAKIKSGSYDQNKLIGWINALPMSDGKRKPTEYRIGDVMMHGVFKHPYILLKKRKTDWLCGLMTSDESCPEVLEGCQSRFFNEKYITKTLFIMTELQGSFLNVYQNDKHLKEVLIKLKDLLK